MYSLARAGRFVISLLIPNLLRYLYKRKFSSSAYEKNTATFIPFYYAVCIYFFILNLLANAHAILKNLLYK